MATTSKILQNLIWLQPWLDRFFKWKMFDEDFIPNPRFKKYCQIGRGGHVCRVQERIETKIIMGALPSTFNYTAGDKPFVSYVWTAARRERCNHIVRCLGFRRVRPEDGIDIFDKAGKRIWIRQLAETGATGASGCKKESPSMDARDALDRLLLCLEENSSLFSAVRQQLTKNQRQMTDFLIANGSLACNKPDLLKNCAESFGVSEKAIAPRISECRRQLVRHTCSVVFSSTIKPGTQAEKFVKSVKTMRILGTGDLSKEVKASMAELGIEDAQEWFSLRAEFWKEVLTGLKHMPGAFIGSQLFIGVDDEQE